MMRVMNCEALFGSACRILTGRFDLKLTVVLGDLYIRLIVFMLFALIWSVLGRRFRRLVFLRLGGSTLTFWLFTQAFLTYAPYTTLFVTSVLVPTPDPWFISLVAQSLGLTRGETGFLPPDERFGPPRA